MRLSWPGVTFRPFAGGDRSHAPRHSPSGVPVPTSDLSDLIDRLAAHRTLGPAPRDELTWLAAHGTRREMATGDVLTPKGARVDGMFVVLSGRIAIFVDRGAGLQKMMEWRAGEVLGLLPFSRMVTPPADTVAQEPTVIFAVPREHLRDMAHACYEITAILVHTMIDRARAFTSSDLHDEKLMLSLIHI